jgi:apolipoprotein N-acyltransferase
VPEDFVLPEGYVRHHQATDDGQRIEAILMFSPDRPPVDAANRPIAIPKDRVVPPELAPPGLPIRRIVIPRRPNRGDPGAEHHRPVFRLGGRMAAGILASAAMAFLYARGGAAWVLGFVALVPWLRTLDQTGSLAATLLGAWGMSIAFTAAVFAWFGPRDRQLHAARRSARSGAAAACRAAVPAAIFRLRTGAPPRRPPTRRRAARVRRCGGVGRDRVARPQAARRHARLRALSVPVAAAGRRPRRRGGPHVRPAAGERGHRDGARAPRGCIRALAPPLALAALVPLLLAGYGVAALSAAPEPAGKPLRMGLVQSNSSTYERLRREKGAGAVVREVLDTHYAMTYDAVERQRADAVLWSETV